MRAQKAVAFASIFLLGLALGGCLYILTVVLVIDEQAILRGTYDMLAAKLGRLEAAGRPPHLIVVSGSNALYSVNSTVLSKTTGLPATNVAMQWSYGPYAMDRVAERVIPGDIVLLPLEYQYYTTVAGRPMLEACYLISQARHHIGGLIDWIAVLAECSPKLILQGVRTKALKALGASFPSPSDILDDLITPEGDIRENLPSKARLVESIQSTQLEALGPDWTGPARIGRAIGRMIENGARVFLTFPVLPEKTGVFEVVAPESLAAISAWARSLGAETLSSPEAHLFPRNCFFDSNYHLHQGCTGTNSMIYGRAILDRLARTKSEGM